MYNPCQHCKSEVGYDPEYCPQICTYGELIKDQAEHEKAVKEWRTVEFPVNMADRVYVVRKSGVTGCTIRNIKSKALGGWTFRLCPIAQDWMCAVRYEYYEVNLAQYGKSWFKDPQKAQAVWEEKYGGKH